jgi:cellulose synthase/poly-beta-1,6-N-acetylglucosamine synthase-like glycosyltransferase
VPIKGVDDDTAANVAALLEQDYPDYHVIFTVESNDDPVVTLLERIAVEDSRVEIVIAGLAQERGQKVHNQLAAVGRTNEDDEILAFMDADAKPGPEWLRALITPLTYGPHIGAATGYRYYIPVTDHTANKIVSVLNAQVAALLGPFRRNFAWGSSMAIRRADFFTYGLNDMWQHALSDDYCLSYCVKNVAKKKLQFVPRCLVASDANFNWASLFEFAVRQYRITKVCAPGIWVVALLGAAVYLAAFSFTLGNTIRGFINPAAYSGHEHVIQMLMFASLYCFSMARGFLLIRGGVRLLPENAREIHASLFWATVGLPWCYVINLVALLGSAVGQTIVWRGVTYKMLSRTRTTVQRPHVGGGMRREPMKIER